MQLTEWEHEKTERIKAYAVLAAEIARLNPSKVGDCYGGVAKILNWIESTRSELMSPDPFPTDPPQPASP